MDREVALKSAQIDNDSSSLGEFFTLTCETRQANLLRSTFRSAYSSVIMKLQQDRKGKIAMRGLLVGFILAATPLTCVFVIYYIINLSVNDLDDRNISENSVITTSEDYTFNIKNSSVIQELPIDNGKTIPNKVNVKPNAIVLRQIEAVLPPKKKIMKHIKENIDGIRLEQQRQIGIIIDDIFKKRKYPEVLKNTAKFIFNRKEVDDISIEKQLWIQYYDMDLNPSSLKTVYSSKNNKAELELDKFYKQCNARGLHFSPSTEVDKQVKKEIAYVIKRLKTEQDKVLRESLNKALELYNIPNLHVLDYLGERDKLLDLSIDLESIRYLDRHNVYVLPFKNDTHAKIVEEKLRKLERVYKDSDNSNIHADLELLLEQL